MNTSAQKNSPSDAQVLAFPAQAPNVEGGHLYFLFSVRQVIDVLREVNLEPLPLGSKYAHGVAEWRGRMLPVLSLESCLGLPESEETLAQRTIVIRGVYQRDDQDPQDLYGICRVGAAVRKLELPLACEPIAAPSWIPQSAYLKGVYAMENNLLLVADVQQILSVVNASVLEAVHGA